MPERDPALCARPTGGPVGGPPAKETHDPAPHPKTSGGAMITVGQKAPDFTAPAYFNNELTSVKLSDYLGKWVALCFYPGDFTFV